jgi:hypothetical protein
MKTHIGPMQQERTLHINTETEIVPVMLASFRETVALLSAVTAAIAIVMFSVWVAGMAIQNVFGAFTLGLGFIFLAMAVDNRGLTAVTQLVTGVALLVLALLHSTVSPDFMIASAVLMAMWTSALLFRYLK